MGVAMRSALLPAPHPPCGRVVEHSAASAIEISSGAACTSGTLASVASSWLRINLIRPLALTETLRSAFRRVSFSVHQSLRSVSVAHWEREKSEGECVRIDRTSERGRLSLYSLAQRSCVLSVSMW